jgi:SAM-dependent methyltransferase
MKIDVEVTEELEAKLETLAPWMHPIEFGPDTFVGFFKRPGIDTTVVTSKSPSELRELFRAAYDAYVASDPGFEIRAFAQFGTGRLLDIGCATGVRSLTAHLEGFSVRGVEIRPEQIAQAKLIASLDQRFDGVEFIHDPMSADNPDFRRGESYDMVLSLGLLYHLTNPFQHLLNLRRLTTTRVLVTTFAHTGERGTWVFRREDPKGITKAAEGISWQPHALDVPDLLRDAGFSQVDVLVPPVLRHVQQPILSGPSRSVYARAGRAVAPGAVMRLKRLAAERRFVREADRLAAAGRSAAYYTYIASV